MSNILTLGSTFDGESVVPIFDGLYAITDDGKLYSYRRSKFLRPNMDKHGYLYFVISIDSVRTTFKAHRMVALAFLPNPESKPTVNHKNGLRWDNRRENLEWATHWEQANDPLTMKHHLQTAAKTDYQAMGAIRNFGRKKTAVYINGCYQNVYSTLQEAAKATSICYSKASECANGKRNSIKGVEFCFV